jgi:hypothetical protein
MSEFFFSPAKRRKARLKQQQQLEQGYATLQALQAARLDPSATNYTEFEQLKYALAQDVKAIDNLGQGEEKRIQLREVIIPRYLPHLVAYCQQDDVYANPILVRMVIWLFDVGDIHQALKYGLIAIEQSQQTPFKRDLPTFVVDSLREFAEAQTQAEEQQQALYYLLSVIDRVRLWPLKDQPKIKFIKALAELFDKQGGEDNERKALSLYCEASRLGKITCKTRINKLIKLYGSPPPEAALVSMTEDRDPLIQDTQGQASLTEAVTTSVEIEENIENIESATKTGGA